MPIEWTDEAINAADEASIKFQNADGSFEFWRLVLNAAYDAQLASLNSQIIEIKNLVDGRDEK